MNQLAVHNEQSVLEQVVIGGDLSRLSPEQRVSYYRQVCSSLGLNPLTKPFDYITLNGKLTLYARKDAADQLRSLNGISIEKPDITFQVDWIIVTVSAHDAHGRTDSDIGAVKKTDMQGNLGNALMKAVTKAKRRVTLSICGLGMLDETEIETIPNARPVVVAETGEIVDAEPPGMLETAQALGGEVVHAEPAPTTTTNGKKPPSRAALVNRYAQLVEAGIALGMEPDKYEPRWTDEELTTKGKALAADIKIVEDSIPTAEHEYTA